MVISKGSETCVTPLAKYTPGDHCRMAVIRVHKPLLEPAQISGAYRAFIFLILQHLFVYCNRETPQLKVVMLDFIRVGFSPTSVQLAVSNRIHRSCKPLLKPKFLRIVSIPRFLFKRFAKQTVALNPARCSRMQCARRTFHARLRCRQACRSRSCTSRFDSCLASTVVSMVSSAMMSYK